ncbi:MAG: hypothetical protein ACK2UK_08150, partial [Candidatus Promineifilaceae bacterium]
MIENFILFIMDFLRFFIVNLGFDIETNVTSVKRDIYFSSVRGLACWWMIDLLTAVRIHILCLLIQSTIWLILALKCDYRHSLLTTKKSFGGMFMKNLLLSLSFVLACGMVIAAEETMTFDELDVDQDG